MEHLTQSTAVAEVEIEPWFIREQNMCQSTVSPCQFTLCWCVRGEQTAGPCSWMPLTLSCYITWYPGYMHTCSNLQRIIQNYWSSESVPKSRLHQNKVDLTLLLFADVASIDWIWPFVTPPHPPKVLGHISLRSAILAECRSSMTIYCWQRWPMTRNLLSAPFI